MKPASTNNREAPEKKNTRRTSSKTFKMQNTETNEGDAETKTSRKRTVKEVTGKESLSYSPKRKATAKTVEVNKNIVENVMSSKGAMVRDVIIPRPMKPSKKYMKIISWNVAGLRSVLKKSPLIIDNLISTHRPDVLCLQETKLQEEHVDEIRDSLLKSMNTLSSVKYTSFWSSSKTKKGYSGTAIFVKGGGRSDAAVSEPAKKQKTLASMWGGKQEAKAAASNEDNSQPASEEQVVEHSRVLSVNYDCVHAYNNKKTPALCPGEGRTITIEFPDYFLINCYVPNSGQNLERLQYRVNTWDPGMRDYIHTLELQKPVVFTGDLNCGFGDLDIHNPHAKHIVKQAGLTPEERQSFHVMLTEGNGLVDSLRYFYPSARGQFSYWSQRTFARPVNKGIRLDYFLCSTSLVQRLANKVTLTAQEHVGGAYENLPEARVVESTATEKESDVHASATLSSDSIPMLYDSYILHEDTVGVSDHCPVVLVIEMN